MNGDAKKEIMTIILKIMAQHPDLRFCQILRDLNVEDFGRDTYYDKDAKVLKRIKTSHLYKQLKES